MRRHRGPNRLIGQIHTDRLGAETPIHNESEEHIQVCGMVQYRPDHPRLH